MGLNITRKEKIFEVEGQINSTTAGYFKTNLIITLNYSKELTIDITKVTEIDASGVRALQSIYNDAQSWNKPFCIIGPGSKEIYDKIRCSEAA
ncbi:MAG: STAS domain-containing protein [Flavobacteriaceae bacterium]|nr:STAS domain-containing protein [Flavobacteriaceae bacterium]